MKKVPLTQNKFSLVDDGDFKKISGFKWYAIKRGNTYYARRNFMKNGKQKTVYLHSFIVDTPRDKEVDHINGDGLDNRRSNLKVCSHIHNMQNLTRIHPKNKSGFKGVHWSERAQKWHVQISVKGKKIYLGLFKKKKDAAHKIATYRKDFVRI